MFDTPRISRPRTMISPNPARPAGPLALASRQCQDVSNLLSDCVETDLDYEIFPLGSPHVQAPNTVCVPASEHSPSRQLTSRRIAMEPADRAVFVATGTTGCVGGSIMKNPYYIKIGRSRTFQEMWAVRLDRRTSK